MEALVIEPAGLQALIDVLLRRGYTVIGPTVRDSVIVNAEIHTIDELPRGWGDDQQAAHYRLRRRGDDALFGYAAAAQSAKPVFFPATALVWRGRLAADGLPVGVEDSGGPPESAATYAFLGIRSCDLHALSVHDRILGERSSVDDDYVHRRRGAFLVAVTCSDPAGTCFCASMGTGPRPESHFDLRLTELIDETRHRFLLEASGERGEQVLAELAGEPADAKTLADAERVSTRASERMGRTLETNGLREVLYASADSPLWDDVATRCLSCTNCTLVCPTCFCSSTADITDLTATTAERRRVWASCFTSDFSYLHGAVVRRSAASRYRQWMTHKFATWVDQFGVQGCVGCGRCITWCPAGIDITEEAAALQAEPAAAAPEVRKPR